MYRWEGSFREDQPRKNPKNPSFSSTLLDEIYRSIDRNDDDNDQNLKFFNKERSGASAKKHSQSKSNGCFAASSVEDEQMARLKRACFIEKWMEKQVNEKVSSLRNPSTSFLQEDDTLFFSTTSSSSYSSSGALSSSDTEFFAAAKSRNSCFRTSRPKPVKTNVTPRLKADYKDQEFKKAEEENHPIKSKSRAMKIYANLKRVKEPISPGARLTSFVNNLFAAAGGNSQKAKNFCSNGGYEEGNFERKSKHINTRAAAASTCSSASSFSRSCLSKTSPNSKQKFNDGSKRTVRFYPVSVIVDEYCRPCGHKRIHDQDSEKFLVRAPPFQQDSMEFKKTQVSAVINQEKDVLRMDRMDQEEGCWDDDDAASDCSSDLFEIDHLALFGKSRFSEELPVYETTHLDTNLAIIASGLIR